MSVSRRAFLRLSLGLAALGSRGPLLKEARAAGAGPLPRRPLGRTGLEVSILGFGGATIGRMAEAEAVAVVEAALEEGVTYIDTASTYRRSEEWIGRALRGADRSRLVIASKALERSRGGASREIERSLKRLGLERLDLLQIHAVNYPWELREVLSPGGALRAALELKEAGHVSHIGITGHRRPEVLLEALEAYPFETALIPINPADKHLHDFASPLEAAARQRDVGLLAMKVLGNGAFGGRAEACLAYTLTRAVASAVVGMRSADQVRQNASVARAFSPMADNLQAALEEELRPMADPKVLTWKR